MVMAGTGEALRGPVTCGCVAGAACPITGDPGKWVACRVGVGGRRSTDGAGRRFHALRDKIYRRDVLWRAWTNVRRNDGAAGIDRITLAMVEQESGVTRLLDEVACELREGTYRPLAARRVFIPKPGSSERRPLSIPTARDRIVQVAAKVVLEPIFEADMLDCSHGFRPKRSAHDALQVLIDESWRGRRWVVETDIASCFEAIGHRELMLAVEERVSDQGCRRRVKTGP